MLSLTRGRSSSGQKSIHMFKKRLVSAPLLVMPQFTQEFILDTDANGEAGD